MNDEQEKYIRKEIQRIRDFCSLVVNLLNNKRIILDNEGIKGVDEPGVSL